MINGIQDLELRSASNGTVFVHLTTFNGEKWIDQSVQSVLNQTYSDLILNISDNGSEDGTRSRIEEWAKKDPRIRYTFHKTNRGAYFNWMLGLEQSQFCPFFTWACQDDFWALDWLEQCVYEIKNHGSMAACGKIVAVDLSGNPVDAYARQLRSHSYMGSRSKLIRLARYALEPEEFGKSGRILAVFRTSELLTVDLWAKESQDVPIQAGDLLIVRRILAVGPIRTFSSSALFKRLGSTTLDFEPVADLATSRKLTLWRRTVGFITHIFEDQKSWYRLYASDSLPLQNYERGLLLLKSLRTIARRLSGAIQVKLRHRQDTT